VALETLELAAEGQAAERHVPLSAKDRGAGLPTPSTQNEPYDKYIWAYNALLINILP
jgi:hypothetical protein